MADGKKNEKEKGLGLSSPFKGTLSMIPLDPSFKVPAPHNDTELVVQPLTQVFESHSISKLGQGTWHFPPASNSHWWRVFTAGLCAHEQRGCLGFLKDSGTEGR